MNYEDTIQYLYDSTPVFEHVGASAYKPGLATTEALDKYFSHPHRKYTTIHVAGTNGKGSVSHTIAAILQAEGYRVGLYTSPHLVDFRERIRVDGRCISEQEVVDFVEKHRCFFEPLHPSFFELTTAMALQYFALQHIDIAVVEVGLGGRLDSTNIIEPKLSVITNIGLDHTQLLGSTLQQIAAEKAGIIKLNVPVVVGRNDEATRPVFEHAASMKGAPIVFAGDDNEVLSSRWTEEGKPSVLYQMRSFGEIEGELCGTYQAENANTVLHAVLELRKSGLHISQDAVKEGFRQVCTSTGLRGRWEVLRQNAPRVICDTGHNVDAWQHLSIQIGKLQCNRLHMVFGMVDDKDVESVVQMLPCDATYYFCQAATHRAIPAERLMLMAHARGLKGSSFTNVAEAYRRALHNAAENDCIFVGGSTYVVADLLTSVQRF